MKKHCNALLATLALGAIAGCASVPMTDDTLDAAAKTFATTPDKATLYVYRNEMFGAAVPMKVEVDGEHVGTTAAKTYLLLMVEPGRHKLSSVAENTVTIDIDVRAGQNYYFWQEVKMGAWTARSLLHQVDESKAQADIQACKLVNTF